MYRQFNIQQFHVLSTQCIAVFFVDHRTNRHSHQLSGLYNVDGERLLRGKDWVFKVETNRNNLNGLFQCSQNATDNTQCQYPKTTRTAFTASA